MYVGSSTKGTVYPLSLTQPRSSRGRGVLSIQCPSLHLPLSQPRTNPLHTRLLRFLSVVEALMHGINLGAGSLMETTMPVPTTGSTSRGSFECHRLIRMSDYRNIQSRTFGTAFVQLENATIQQDQCYVGLAHTTDGAHRRKTRL